MMTCRDARPLLLEADLEDLRGESPSALAGHIESCDACRAQAQRILAVESALANALDSQRPRQSADIAAAAARVIAGRRRLRRRLSIALPLLAAASVALALNLARGPRVPVRSLALATPLPPIVEVAPGRNVIVFDTGDPKITVVWVY